MIDLSQYGIESVGIENAIINALKAGVEFEYDGWGYIPKSLKVSGRHIGLLLPPDNVPPTPSDDDFLAAFESYVKYEGLYYEIHYSVI